MGFFDAIPGVVGSLVGGILGSNTADANRQAAEQANAQNIALQKEFATSGIQWRAADVMHAYNQTGIHPLALLGVQGSSYTPTNFVGSGSSPMGDAVSSAGQNISRAMMATSSDKARLDTITRMDDLTREGMSLDNELRRVRIASEKARLFQGVGPAMPNPGQSRFVDGQGNTSINTLDLINSVPSVDTVNPDVSHAQNIKGGFNPMASKATKELIEDDAFQGAMHFWRNVIAPYFDKGAQSPPNNQRLAPNEEWVYDPVWGYRRAPLNRSTHTSERRRTMGVPRETFD